MNLRPVAADVRRRSGQLATASASSRRRLQGSWPRFTSGIWRYSLSMNRIQGELSGSIKVMVLRPQITISTDLTEV